MLNGESFEDFAVPFFSGGMMRHPLTVLGLLALVAVANFLAGREVERRFHVSDRRPSEIMVEDGVYRVRQEISLVLEEVIDERTVRSYYFRTYDDDLREFPLDRTFTLKRGRPLLLDFYDKREEEKKP